MAFEATYLRVTSTEVIVKCTGTDGDSGTIDLDAVDMLPYGPIFTTYTGTITSSTGSTGVTGSDTAFASSWVNAKLYNTSNELLGTVETVLGATGIVLAATGLIDMTDEAYHVQFLSQLIVSGSSQAVNITGVVWTGSTGAIVTLTRDSTRIMTLQAGAAGALDFGGQMMVPDTVKNSNDIDVAIAGGDAELWLKLRKTNGYVETLEPHTYGPYDDPSKVG